MPREIRDLQTLMNICSRPDAKSVTIKKNRTNTKFKIRCSSYLYTYTVKDSRKADRIEKTIHPTVTKITVGQGKGAGKAAKK